MDTVIISQSVLHKADIFSFSSQDHDLHAPHNLLSDTGFWRTRKNETQSIEFVTLSFNDILPINCIEIIPSPDAPGMFPSGFRVEISDDAKIWNVLHTEKNYVVENNLCRLNFPLVVAKYIKLVITEHHSTDDQFFTEIALMQMGIAGIREAQASSASSPATSAERLFDGSTATFWETELKTKSSKESLHIDLGAVYQVNSIVFTSCTSGFPEQFSLEISADNNVWFTILDIKNFAAAPIQKYMWNMNASLVRYIRFEAKTVLLEKDTYGIRISDIEIGALIEMRNRSQSGTIYPQASIFQAGIVKLAKDGETQTGSVLQADDRRLRDATTIFKGIVQLADDSDTTPARVVQASDSRLKPSTELRPGIVRLAYDRENKPGIAVQGNDSRLREATEKTFGIVRLCPDGQYSENTVVTGADGRLQKATLDSYGICRLSEDGATVQDTVVQATDRRLKDASTLYPGIVELAEDGEDAPGVAVQGSDRRLKDASTRAKGIVELSEDGEDAPGVVVQGNDRRLKDASTKAKGIVELAEDGEDAPGLAVQGNDRRIKDATTKAKGIVRLAEDGEDAPGVVVQSNDRRIKNATTHAKGIVELAEDGEDAPGVVVQGNDKRLRDASTNAKGIVELAEDGEDAPGVVVQGNDKRLRDASSNAKGIVRLAGDGEDASDAAVQGNDKRLREATTHAKGIVQLAADGENKRGVAVQGDDRRLKNATTSTKGIVELAEDGEDTEGVVVQGNDRRLKNASDNAYGIMKYARNGEMRAGIAVQANDERLHNAREALPHSHPYAPLQHDFNSHSGSLSIKDKKAHPFLDITPPPSDSTIIHGQNDSKDDGSVGIAGISGLSSDKYIRCYGVLGHSRFVGVRGQSSGGGDTAGCGVMGLSRFGAGGIFASEHTFSLIAEGYARLEKWDDTITLKGNGEALYAHGISQFNGKVILLNDAIDPGEAPGNIAEYFVVDEAEYTSPGDILIVSTTGGSILSRSRNEYCRSVVGVVTANPVLVLNNSGTEQRIYPVALAGKVYCKVDARNHPIHAGDLIVTSNTPGYGMKGTIDGFDKIGSVIGKALDSMEDGIGTIPIFITHQ